MHEEDVEPRAKKPDWADEPLDTLSIDELKLRIELLRSEISRCEEAIKLKQAGLASAEAVFKQ